MRGYRPRKACAPARSSAACICGGELARPSVHEGRARDDPCSHAAFAWGLLRQQRLYFWPLPHGQGSLRPIVGVSRRICAVLCRNSGMENGGKSGDRAFSAAGPVCAFLCILSAVENAGEAGVPAVWTDEGESGVPAVLAAGAVCAFLCVFGGTGGGRVGGGARGVWG